MDIEFDPAKDRTNSAKHGVSLRLAEGFDLDSALVAVDDSQQVQETRYHALGFIGDRLFSLIFTLRGERLRPISLRKATKQEMQRYAPERPR